MFFNEILTVPFSCETIVEPMANSSYIRSGESMDWDSVHRYSQSFHANNANSMFPSCRFYRSICGQTTTT